MSARQLTFAALDAPDPEETAPTPEPHWPAVAVPEFGTFTKTEALRRLRLLSKLVKRTDGDVPRNAKAEIGTRTVTVRTASRPATSREAFAPGDDLVDWLALEEAARLDEVAGPGLVVHIYFSGQWRGEGPNGPFINWRHTRREVIDLLVERHREAS
jgi:hypothetical protein